MRRTMQHGVLIKWHSILRPELNATLHRSAPQGFLLQIATYRTPRSYVNDTSRLSLNPLLASFDIRRYCVASTQSMFSFPLITFP